MMFQRSKTGSMWHLARPARVWEGDQQVDANVAVCRYQYNMDRPIVLAGEIVSELPAGSTLCKRCAYHLKQG